MYPIPLALWEVYESQKEAVRALGIDSVCHRADRPPLTTLPLGILELEEIGAVLCVTYEWNVWTRHAVTLQSQLRKLVEELGRDRVVLNFSGQKGVGSASISCIYSLARAIGKAGGRFGLCNVSAELQEFFRVHGDPVVFPPAKV